MIILFAVAMVVNGIIAYKTKSQTFAMNFGFFVCAVLAEGGI